MENKYWIRIDGKNAGPFTISELVSKDIQPNSYVWKEGLENWTKLENISEYQNYVKENKKNILSQLLKYALIISLSIFFFLFIYNFFKLPYYKLNYGGKDGLDIIGEVAFDHTPLNLKLPTLLFFLLIPIILLLTIIYSIFKSKKESIIPIAFGLIIIVVIPFFLSFHIVEASTPSSTLISNDNTSTDIIITENESILEIPSEVEEPPKKEVGKRMYAVVIYSTLDSEYDEELGHFTDIFIVDSEITDAQQTELIDKKVFTDHRVSSNEKINIKRLKCFDTKKEAHDYIERFRNSLFFRPADFTTFDTISNYTTSRIMQRINNNL